MPWSVVLTNRTDRRGRADLRRARSALSRAEDPERPGPRLETALWTQSDYDIVSVTGALDDETLAVALLRLTRQGNVRQRPASARA